MAKRSKPQVWERTLWAIQLADGSLADINYVLLYQRGEAMRVFRSKHRRQAAEYCVPGKSKPVKVRERIEVIE